MPEKQPLLGREAEPSASYDAFFLALLLGLLGPALALCLLEPRPTLWPAAFTGLGLSATLSCIAAAVAGVLPPYGLYLCIASMFWASGAGVLWASAVREAGRAHAAAKTAAAAV